MHAPTWLGLNVRELYMHTYGHIFVYTFIPLRPYVCRENIYMMCVCVCPHTHFLMEVASDLSLC